MIHNTSRDLGMSKDTFNKCFEILGEIWIGTIWSKNYNVLLKFSIWIKIHMEITKCIAQEHSTEAFCPRYVSNLSAWLCRCPLSFSDYKIGLSSKFMALHMINSQKVGKTAKMQWKIMIFREFHYGYYRCFVHKRLKIIPFCFQKWVSRKLLGLGLILGTMIFF